MEYGLGDAPPNWEQDTCGGTWEINVAPLQPQFVDGGQTDEIPEAPSPRAIGSMFKNKQIMSAQL